MPRARKPKTRKRAGVNIRDGMQRELTDEERAAISARCGATCDVLTVTVCKPGAFSAWDDIMSAAQKRMKAARDRKKGKKDE